MGLRLIGEVALDGSGFEAGLHKLELGAERVGETLKGLALTAVGVYGIEQAIHKTVETAEKLVDTSRRLGVGLEALQEFGFAAKQNGADIDALTGFIEKLNSTRIDPKKFESFAKLGISQPDLSSLKVEDLIMKISANVRTRSPQEVIGPLREIGGRGAGQLLPMLREDLDEVREAAHRLGVIMKSEDAVMLKFVADEMSILAQLMVAQLAPAIVVVAEAIMGLMAVLKSNLTFWKTFSQGKGGQGVKTLWDELLSPHFFNQKPPSEIKKAFQDIWQGFVESGAKSEGDQVESAERFVRLRNMLMDKQKLMEQIGATPDFESGTGQPKQRNSRRELYTDSLLRVGNFLGGAQNPMISIAHTQTRLLTQIANNTSKKAKGGKEPGHEIPHH